MSEIEILYRGQFLELHREGRWEYAARTHRRGAAHIVAVTAQQELVLVEQFRVPVHARTVELPAGIIGDEAEHQGETVESCALRELEEETGFRGSRAELLVAGPTAPGLTSEMLHMVRVTGLQRVSAGGGVDGENITPHCVPLREVQQWLDARQAAGLIVDHRVYAGLYFAMQAPQRKAG